MKPSSPLSRRRFLQSSSLAAASAALVPLATRASTPLASPSILVPPSGGWSDPDRHALAALGLEAARAAGATYADVRLSRTVKELWGNPWPTYPGQPSTTIGVGVRVLVNGYWGFLGSAAWTPNEMARLARGAVELAKASSLGRTREIVMAPLPSIAKGEWIMPVKYDPFLVPLGEKYDFFNQVKGMLNQLSFPTSAGMTGAFTRTEVVYASSEGASWAQTTYLSGGGFGVNYVDEPGLKKFYGGGAESGRLSWAGKGWEHFCDSGIFDAIPEMVDTAEQTRDIIPVDVGRYDLVCTAQATAALVDGSIGAAAELDRAMGYEADSGGTSYLDQPLEMLGNQVIGTKTLTVTANRSHVGGAATCKWDEEGVTPDEYTFVKDGILTDYHTTREQVEWLTPYYQKTGRAMRSHGCSYAPNASQTPMQNLPNLQMMPGAEEKSFEELVANTGKGVALISVSFTIMDPQQLNGTAYGQLREIRGGKLGRVLNAAGLQFRAPEFWKSMSGLGGPSSARWVGLEVHKGEPTQMTTHSVGAVPAQFKNAAIIDVTRKA